MNKKIIIPSLFLFFLIFLIPQLIFAQQQEQDYLNNLEQYRNQYNEFTTFKNKYLQYKSLSSKDEAITSTKNLLIQRNLTLKSYFIALTGRLRSTSAIVGSEYQKLILGQLDQEINWLDGQINQLQSMTAPSLDDLFIVSDRLEIKKDAYAGLAYQSLSLSLIGKVKDLQQESVSLTNLIKQEIAKLDKSKQSKYKEWLQELENKNYLSQKAIESAETNLQILQKKKRDTELKKAYDDIKTNLAKVKEYLEQAYLFQKELTEGISNE